MNKINIKKAKSEAKKWAVKFLEIRPSIKITAEIMVDNYFKKFEKDLAKAQTLKLPLGFYFLEEKQSDVLVANFIDNYSAKYRFVKQQIKANTKDIKCVVNNTQFVESVMEAMDRRDLPSNDPYPLINKGVEYFSGRMMEIPRGFLSGSSLKDNFGTLDVINWNLKNYLYGRINFLSCEKKNFDKIKR